MSSNIDQTIFCCALAIDKHFIENPITLSCGHSVCKLCVPKKVEILVCKICGEKNEIDLNKVKESIGMKKLLSLNLSGMLEIISDRYNESVTCLEEEIKNVYGRVEIEVSYIKEEIEIKVESLKIELEKLKENLFIELDDYKQELNEQLNTFDTNEHKLNLANIKAEIEKNGYSEKSVYDYQTKLKELNKMISKIQTMNHHVFLKLNNESANEIGLINCNFTGLQGRIKLGNHKIIELQDDPNDLCMLPNGSLLFSNYFTSKQLSLYDDSFNFVKNISKINDQDINPFSVETNNKDRIYINNWTIIYMTDLNFNYLGEYGTNKSEINGPCFMLYSNEVLYVCDMDNKSILKLNSELKPIARIFLNIKPIQIQILYNLACIVPENKDEFFYFYDLNGFNLKYKYNRCVNTIVHENKFFCINGGNIDCYDREGIFSDSIKFNVHSLNFSTCPFMKIKQNKLLSHRYEKKLFVL